MHFTTSPVRWVGLQTGRKVRSGRIDGRLDVARGPIDVAIKSELQDDAGSGRHPLRVISVTSAILPRWRSSGLSDACCDRLGAGTEMVGKSTCYSAETGRLKKARMPATVSQQRGCDRAGNEQPRQVHSSASPRARGGAERRSETASRSKS